MPSGAVIAIAATLAYLVGSIPFGILLARRKGIDVTKAGSGNIGATNVARTAGRKLGLIALVLDAGKGAGPTLVALHGPFEALASDVGVFAVSLAPALGHCFSPWLRFRGGKGVATSLGVVLATDPLIAGVSIALFVAVYSLAKVVSVASMTAAVAVPLLFWRLGERDVFTLVGACLAVLIIIQHRGNIGRLVRGRELPV